MTTFKPWSVVAANLPEHANNAIHTDVGARAAGFRGALVAGVTTYAYMTHVPATAWGLGWLSSGGAEVRFKQPVMDRDPIDLVIGEIYDGEVDDGDVTAKVGTVVNATARFFERPEPISERNGPELDPIEFVLDASWSDYGMRAGDDAEVYAEHRIAHATSWPRIANQFCHEQLVTGSWIHVRSRIRHHDVARIGATLRATAEVVDRFDSRAGERAVLHVRISADGVAVASVEHEAVISLAS